MNWSLFNAPAWDFPADTRGYTRGLTVDLRQEGWSLAYGRFQMPTEANGSVLDAHTLQAHGDALQLTLRGAQGGSLRLLAFENHARMGDYALALAHPGTPDITATRGDGRVKRGWVSVQDVSALHRAYLAHGGLGFVLGDGRLNPGRERLVEAYYAWSMRPWATLTPDVQCVWNPGTNRDRGPVKVWGLRLRLAI